MTSRERFEAWISAPPYEKHTHRGGRESAWPNQYQEYATQFAWEAWQAAEAETARRCAELAVEPYTRSGSEFASRIRAEYPEAFK